MNYKTAPLAELAARVLEELERQHWPAVEYTCSCHFEREYVPAGRKNWERLFSRYGASEWDRRHLWFDIMGTLGLEP